MKIFIYKIIVDWVPKHRNKYVLDYYVWSFFVLIYMDDLCRNTFLLFIYCHTKKFSNILVVVGLLTYLRREKKYFYQLRYFSPIRKHLLKKYYFLKKEIFSHLDYSDKNNFINYSTSDICQICQLRVLFLTTRSDCNRLTPSVNRANQTYIVCLTVIIKDLRSFILWADIWYIEINGVLPWAAVFITLISSEQ